MRLTYTLQSLPAQILSALINAVCLNSSKIMVTLPSCMGPSQRVMKTMSSFNTRAVPVNPFPSGFQGFCSGFSIFLVISENYRLMKIRSTNTSGEFRAPADFKDGVLCHDS